MDAQEKERRKGPSQRLAWTNQQQRFHGKRTDDRTPKGVPVDVRPAIRAAITTARDEANEGKPKPKSAVGEIAQLRRDECGHELAWGKSFGGRGTKVEKEKENERWW